MIIIIRLGGTLGVDERFSFRVQTKDICENCILSVFLYESECWRTMKIEVRGKWYKKERTS
uniref:Uncharacterized protein n=1 Tax=Arion vulgaris TaxID=1028688 RepID=A0A0B7B109_9EUPU